MIEWLLKIVLQLHEWNVASNPNVFLMPFYLQSDRFSSNAQPNTDCNFLFPKTGHRIHMMPVAQSLTAMMYLYEQTIARQMYLLSMFKCTKLVDRLAGIL